MNNSPLSLVPGPIVRNLTTTLQLKRKAAKLRAIIAKEEKRQQAAREVESLERRLRDTIAAGFEPSAERYGYAAE